MSKTKEQIKKYNKEYFARPDVIARAKIRNAKYRQRRQEYKKTPKGIISEKKYRSKPETRTLKEWERIKRRYGISQKDYNELVKKQNGVCVICSTESKEKLHIDHNHNTGKVRGLLCGNCNRGIGLFHDKIYLLLNAVSYLEKGNEI